MFNLFDLLMLYFIVLPCISCRMNVKQPLYWTRLLVVSLFLLSSQVSTEDDAFSSEREMLLAWDLVLLDRDFNAYRMSKKLLLQAHFTISFCPMLQIHLRLQLPACEKRPRHALQRCNERWCVWVAWTWGCRWNKNWCCNLPGSYASGRGCRGVCWEHLIELTIDHSYARALTKNCLSSLPHDGW